MDIIEAIKSRRAVKHFDPNHFLTKDEEVQLLSLAQLSPTAFNIQNWRLLIVKDPSIRQKIREVSWGQAQVTEASLLIVICADLKAWDKAPERYWKNAPDAVRDFMVPAIGGYYRGHETVQRDEAMRSCGLVAQNLMLSAKALGYDSCPMDGFNFEQVGKIINLPEDHVISMFVVIGKGTQPARERGGFIPMEEMVKIDRF